MAIWRLSGAGVEGSSRLAGRGSFNSLTPSTPLADLRELNRIDCCFRRINVFVSLIRAEGIAVIGFTIQAASVYAVAAAGSVSSDVMASRDKVGSSLAIS